MDFQGILQPGTKLGAILIERQRGADSTGELYDAVIEGQRVKVLVRVLNPELSGEGPAMQNLLGMLKHFAGCKSPHLSQMVAMDLTTQIQRWILVTSLGNANTLAERVQLKNLTPPAVVMIMKQAITAMIHAHEGNFIHGNLNLDNVALTLDGKVKILNFAFAGTTAEDRKANSVFQAPELMKGGEPNFSSDVYALGMVFQKLFQAFGVSNFPVELRRVAERMCTQDQATRFQTMAEAKKMLGTGHDDESLDSAKKIIAKNFERTRTIQIEVDREVAQARFREKMPKPVTIVICAVVVAVLYLKVVPMFRKKDFAATSLALLSQAAEAGKKATGVQRALDAKQAAIDMKNAVDQSETRKLAEADAASGDGLGAPGAKPVAEPAPATPAAPVPATPGAPAPGVPNE